MTQVEWQVPSDAPEIYEQYLVEAIFLPWAHVLIDIINPKEGENLLDVACGTGIVARTAAPYVGGRGKVVGLDLNTGMLAVARSKLTPSKDRVEWHEASASDMPFDDQTFNCVCCQAGLQFFPDRLAALQEMYRVLVPGGKLAAVVWRAIEHSPGFAALEAALKTHANAEAASIMEAPFVFGDAPDELHSLVLEAGFDEVRVRFETRMMRFPSVEAFFDSYTSGSPLASYVSEIATREKLISEMGNRLSNYIDSEGLAFPLEGQVVIAVK